MTPSARSLSSLNGRWLVVLAALVLGAGVGAAVRSPASATAPRKASTQAPVRAATSPVPVPVVPAAAKPADRRFSATFVAATTDSVTVQGIGTLQGTPDVAIVSLQVVVQRQTSGEALDAANAVVSKVINSLRKHDVSPRDIQSTGLSLNPTYEYHENQQPTLTGYQAGQSITAKLRSSNKRGGTISAAAAVAPGEVTINGLSYDLDRDSVLLTGAQKQAFAAAKKKAAEYAGLAGRSLGRVMTISEVTSPSAGGGPYPISVSGGMAAAPATDVPLAAGSQDVSVAVTVTWALR